VPYTVRDIVMNADRFREAYPNWPHPEPEDPGPAPEAEADVPEAG
jgi:hypothetical protein